MLVQDIMHVDVKVALPDTLVREVAIVMCFNKISGLPVVDGDNNIVGVISEKDILRAMYPGVDEYMQSGRLDFESLESQYRNILGLKVRELMSTKIHTVSPDVPVLKAVSIMCLYKIRRIPVAVKGKLVGIISMGDVHKAIFTRNLEAAAGQAPGTAASRVAG
jgi:CBS domain-containing protein